VISLGPEEGQKEEAEEDFQTSVDEGRESLEEHGMVPEVEMFDKVVPLTEEEGAVGEEAGVGIGAEGREWYPRGQDERGLVGGNVDGVNARDLQVGIRGRTDSALGEDEFAVYEHVHADSAVEIHLGAATDGNAHEQGERPMMGWEQDMKAEPGEGAVVGMMLVWAVISLGMAAVWTWT